MILKKHLGVSNSIHEGFLCQRKTRERVEGGRGPLMLGHSLVYDSKSIDFGHVTNNA
jgi:hypothetical protein